MQETKKFGLLSTLLSLLLIGIIILVNAGVSVLATRYPLKADLSKNRVYQLSDYTKAVLHALDKDIQVYVFYEKGQESNMIMEILYRYRWESSHIHIEQVSPAEKPELSLKYDQSNEGLHTGTVIFDCEGKFITVTESDISNYSAYLGTETEMYAEEKFTESIMTITSGVSKKVYKITGHGEDSAYEMHSTLLKYGYEEAEIALSSGAIPSDCTALMMVAPSKDYSDAELAVLDAYLQNGGCLMVCLSPVALHLDNLYAYLNEWGIEPVDAFVAEGDTNRVAFNTRTMFYGTGMGHPIGNSVFDNDYMVLVSNTKPIYAQSVNGISTRAIMATSENGYIVSAEDLDNGQMVEAGQVPIAVAAEGTQGKIAVFGSQLYFVESLFNEASLANKDLFLNTLEWLHGDYVHSGIRPKSLQNDVLTISNAQTTAIIVVVIAFPVCILAFGIYTFIRRRHM